MKELGVSQSAWLNEFDYWDRVEWLAYFINENKKQVAMQVNNEIEAAKAANKKKK